MQFFGGPASHILSPVELELLVCGSPNLDFRAFQAAAEYSGGFSAEHKVCH